MSGAGEARALARALAGAEESRIAKAVALVDAMPERGAADGLIAPLRGRLAALHLHRAVNFGRLLFLPLDPVIVAPQGWQPGTALVPRTALAPLIAAVRVALGPAVAPIGAALAACPDAGVAGTRLGPALWPHAVAALRALAATGTVPGWDATGLPAAAAAPLTLAIAAVLEAWPGLCPLAVPLVAADGDCRALVEAALRGAAAAGPEAWALVAAVALARAADPVVVALVAAEQAEKGGPALHRGLEQALTVATGVLERAAEAPATLAADAVRRAGRLVAALVDRAGPSQRAALGAFARRLDASCRARVTAECGAALLAPLAALTTPANDAAMTGFETAARGLRDLAQEARRIGSAGAYDALFRDAAEKVRAAPEGLTRMDRARLVEILDGPEAGLAVLTG